MLFIKCKMHQIRAKLDTVNTTDSVQGPSHLAKRGPSHGDRERSEPGKCESGSPALVVIMSNIGVLFVF